MEEKIKISKSVIKQIQRNLLVQAAVWQAEQDIREMDSLKRHPMPKHIEDAIIHANEIQAAIDGK